jgi:hypothetical protein
LLKVISILRFRLGFKKEGMVRLYDPASTSWTDPLKKKDSFALPCLSDLLEFYWLEGQELWLDTPVDVAQVGLQVIVWAESMDAESNEDWLTVDFPDAVLYVSVVRGAAEFRKTEVAQLYSALWTDERESLAIYLNELERR